MKSENILRAARNSLLCFFMALGAGFLVACGNTPDAPATPSDVSVVEQSESEILITWDAVPGATSYNLYRSTVSSVAYAQIGGNIPALTLRYLDSGLDPNTEYFYQLEACNSGGCSSRSAESLVTTRISPPVLSVQSEDEIEAAWSAVQGATIYKLYRSTVSRTVSSVAYAQIGGDLSTLRYLDSSGLYGELYGDTEYFYELEACNSDGCLKRSPEVSVTTYPPKEFVVYLSDAAAEGVEYSGPIGDGLTWKGGAFSAVKGVFEFSIADTTLGRVRLDGDWANAHVTPADFVGVDEQEVIDIARAIQGLDEDGEPQTDGISVSQRVRTDVRGDLFDEHALLFAEDDEFDVFSNSYLFPSRAYTIPKEGDAKDHFVATRRCLFSGVYDGSYRATVFSSSGDTVSLNPNEQFDEGRIYYAIQPFADRATGVKFSNENPGPIENRGITTALSGPVDIGVIGSGTITLSKGNELSFVTPRVVAGIWQEVNQEGVTEITVSGTSALTLAEGNPGATRRIVGVEKVDGGERVLGLYVLDYFGEEGPPSGNFRGRYYDVTDNQNFALLLTIAGGASWPTDATPTTLTLIGTRDDRGNKVATAITVGVTVGVIRGDNNRGSFGGTGIGVSGAPGVISGTWCDISGATGVASPVPLPQSPKVPPRAAPTSTTRIDIAWDYPIAGARIYNLYRRKTTEPRYTQVLVDGGIETRGYRDRNLEAGTKYSYQLEVCNTSGCATRSPEVSATTFFPPSP